HLRFYWHDVLSGPDPTAVPVAQAAASSTNASASGFGTVVMIDDPMTVGPELSSRLVGRAQGFYALAAKEETALLMAMNLAFVEGKYNGSTIAVLGRNAVFSGVREMPVVGGSGLFRLARGYAQARTYSLDPRTGDAVVEYNKPVREKLSHLRFYWHDVLSGPDPTAVPVAQAAASSTNASASGFGKVFMIDDPMTVGPELSSRLVGRAQGFYAFAAKEETALLMALNLAFLEGKYNGSTIAILGRNAVFSGVREMPVVGGSGLFRLARGY
ncbi:unnamed protein product, partial [Musa textilis]